MLRLIKKSAYVIYEWSHSETVPSPPSTTSGVTMPLPPVMGSLGSPVPASLTDSMDAVINHQGSILILLLQSIFFKSTLENEQDFAPKYYGTYNRKTHYVAKSNCIIYILIDRTYL